MVRKDLITNNKKKLKRTKKNVLFKFVCSFFVTKTTVDAEKTKLFWKSFAGLTLPDKKNKKTKMSKRTKSKRTNKFGSFGSF